MAGKGQTKGFIFPANAQRAREEGIKNIMARLKIGYPHKGGYMNDQYMEADRKMLEIYLNPQENQTNDRV